MSRSEARVQLIGTGIYVPSGFELDAALDTRWSRPAGSTFREVGVRRRHVAGPTDTSSSMAAAAANDALANAGLHATEIDCIVSACSVMEQAIPCLAVQIQRAIGLGQSGIPAFDVNSTCLSFVTALDIMSLAVSTNRYKNVLIVSSELPTLAQNPENYGTTALFGDGAAAAIIQRSGDGIHSQILASHMKTYSVGSKHCQIRGGGTRLRSGNTFESWRESGYFEMDGRATYRLAFRYLSSFFDELLAKAGVAIDQLSLVIPHQASGKALDHMASALKIPDSKLVRIIHDYGNQVAASIPTALHLAIQRGSVQRGDLIALVGTGAGLSMGGIVLRY